MPGVVAHNTQPLGQLVRSNLNWVVGANAACALLNFLSMIWFARTLGPQAIGEYAAIVTALQILTAFISPGFNHAVIRSPHQEDLVAAASVATTVQSVLLLAVSGIGYAVYAAQDPESASGILGPGLLIACGIALSFFMYLLSAPFEAQINYRFLSRIRLITVVLSVGVGMAVANGGFGLYALAVRDLLSTGLMLAAVAWSSPLRLRWQCSKDGLKQLARFSGSLWALNILERVTLRLDYAAVGWLFGKESLGIYFAVRNLFEGTTAFLLAPIQTVLYASLCRFERLAESFQTVLNKGFGYLGIAGLGVACAYASSSFVVSLLFGDRYREGNSLVTGLVLYSFSLLWFELMKTFALSRNRHHSMIAARATQLGISLMLVYPLTQLAGLGGAGMTTGIAALAMACAGTQITRGILREQIRNQRDGSVDLPTLYPRPESPTAPETRERSSQQTKPTPGPHSFAQRTMRVLWGLVWLVAYRPSPRLLHGWRRFLLRLFGAKIGKGAHPYPSAKIWAPWNLEMGDHSCLASDVDCYSVDRVVLGARATVSQYSYLCAAGHDYRHPGMPLTTAPITIGAGAWIAADVFVGPGVTVGEGAVIGARSSLFRDIDPWTVAVGNPAKAIKKRDPTILAA